MVELSNPLDFFLHYKGRVNTQSAQLCSRLLVHLFTVVSVITIMSLGHCFECIALPSLYSNTFLMWTVHHNHTSVLHLLL